MPFESSPLHRQSDRVCRLSATCIQAVVRLRHGAEIRFEEAINLARVHDLPTSVRIIREKLELFNGVPKDARIRLATTEATFTGGLIPKQDLEQTISVRRASIGMMQDNAQAGRSREILVASLRDLRREWEQWAREFVLFIDRLDELRTQGERDLKLLRLDPEANRRARSELEKVVLVALLKAGDLEYAKAV